MLNNQNKRYEWTLNSVIQLKPMHERRADKELNLELDEAGVVKWTRDLS
jgi:hypothetical protein